MATLGRQTTRDRKLNLPAGNFQNTVALLAFSNGIIPLIAAGLVLSASIMLQVYVNAWIVALLMSGAFLTYTFERVWLPGPEDLLNHHDRVIWLSRNRVAILVATIGAAIVFVVSAILTITLAALPLVAALSLVAALYCLPMLPGGGRLKSIWFLKPILIAGAWAAGTVLLPVLLATGTLSSAAWAVAGYRLLFLLPNTLIADFPDADGDRRSGLRTTATVFGERVFEIAKGVAGMVPVAALAIWLTTPVGPLVILESLIAIAFLYVLRTQDPLPRVFYVLYIDLLVALPLVLATLHAMVG